MPARTGGSHRPPLRSGRSGHAGPWQPVVARALESRGAPLARLRLASLRTTLAGTRVPRRTAGSAAPRFATHRPGGLLTARVAPLARLRLASLPTTLAGTRVPLRHRWLGCASLRYHRSSRGRSSRAAHRWLGCASLRYPQTWRALGVARGTAGSAAPRFATTGPRAGARVPRCTAGSAAPRFATTGRRAGARVARRTAGSAAPRFAIPGRRAGARVARCTAGSAAPRFATYRRQGNRPGGGRFGGG
jgi:hypothetical protein